MKSNKNIIKLVLDNKFGKVYFISSIFIIVVCIASIVLTLTIATIPFIWILSGLSLAYCILILVGEIIRARTRVNEEQPSEDK